MTANVALTDSFDQWRVKTNEVVVMTQTDGMSNFIKVLDTTNSISNTTGSIITAGGLGVLKSAVIGEDLTVHGNVIVDKDITISGNLVFGDAETDQVTFDADINSNMIPNVDMNFNLGNTTFGWANTFTGLLHVEQGSAAGNSAITIASADIDEMAIDISAEQTTANVVDIDANSLTTGNVLDIAAPALTTGSALSIDSNSPNSSDTRDVVKISQNHADAALTTTLHLLSDRGRGLFINSTSQSSGYSLEIDSAHAATGVVKIATAASSGTILDIQAEAITSGKVINIYDNTLTTGSALYIDSDSSAAGARNIASIIQNNNASAASGSTTLYLRNDHATAHALKVVGAVTVGADTAGHDVKFFGTTTGQYMLWDESADELVLTTDSKLSFHDAAGGENIVASADGHLEINAGTTLDITAPTVGINASTVVNVDGPVSVYGNFGVGQDGTGHNVFLYGDTLGSWVKWDWSNDSLRFTDSTPIEIGDNQDMSLYHDGTNSYITNITGTLNILANHGASNSKNVNIGGSISVVTIGDNLTVTDTLTELSMREMKTNIEPIENILPAVLQMQGVSFDWKKDEDGGLTNYGFIAEDVDKILPNLVSHDEEGKAQGIQYSKMTAVLLEAIKEQQVQIDELKSKIN